MRTTIRKAVGAAVGAGTGALGTAMLDGSLSAAESIVAAGMTLVTFGVVWRLRYQVPHDAGVPRR
jgi:hypothetical protein